MSKSVFEFSQIFIVLSIFSCQKTTEKQISVTDLDFADYQKGALIRNYVHERLIYFPVRNFTNITDSTELKMLNHKPYELRVSETYSASGNILSSKDRFSGTLYTYDSNDLLSNRKHIECFSLDHQISYVFDKKTLWLYQIWQNYEDIDTIAFLFNKDLKLIKEVGRSLRPNENGIYVRDYTYLNNKLKTISSRDSVLFEIMGHKIESNTEFIYDEHGLSKTLYKYRYIYDDADQSKPNLQISYFGQNGLLDSTVSKESVTIYKYE
ncbi:MAG: YD repeat-containing protein [Bacteroidia bacterium]